VYIAVEVLCASMMLPSLSEKETIFL